MPSRHPITRLLDLLGRRWTLRVLWELRTGDAFTFRELRARCDDLSPSVLNQRLRELREGGIVEADGGYRLTPLGLDLIGALAPLNTYAKRWAGQ
jgi:DNA-binding HxlR family transcriptional regulator